VSAITVVGEADRLEEFEECIRELIELPFRVTNVTPLSSDSDGKQFLGIIEADSKNELVGDAARILAQDLDLKFESVMVHDSSEEAWEWARENYGEEAYSRFMTPIITAGELRARDFFFALIHSNDMGLVRGFLDGKPVVVFAHNSDTDKDSLTLLTPFAIMVDEDIAERLELPFKSGGSMVI